ncbi:ras-related protein Rab-1B [Condylostylus longicornis]|uniref:ras-related protein Rab-1B n=1 Tax=Condylostylus longicornis TaxID=2530218 RepID=UPI00244DFC95|nr:ras-related protein Rab-1B [Condylostylus longicornis]
MATIRIPEQKVILCGDYGVGKSSLFRRFATNTFVTATDRNSTLGLDHIHKFYTSEDRTIRLQLWDTGGMERVASVTSSYYKFAEGAILVFALDNETSFHSLSQHLLDVVTYAENAKIFICGNKSDLEQSKPQVSNSDILEFTEQCQSMISSIYKTSCKTGEGIEEMFQDIASILIESNRSKLDLQALEEQSFKIDSLGEDVKDPTCIC